MITTKDTYFTFLILQLSPTVKLEFSFCNDKHDLFGTWLIIIAVYEMLLLGTLLYLSYRNSRLSRNLQAYREEGQSGTRTAVAITLLTLATVITFNILHIDFFKHYIVLYWGHVIYSTVSPVLYLGVFFIPKVSYAKYWILDHNTLLIMYNVLSIKLTCTYKHTFTVYFDVSWTS